MVARRTVFNPKIFLTTVGAGKQMMSFRKGQMIFLQGDPSDAIFVILEGWVALSLRLQDNGRNAAIDIRGANDFVGIDSFVSQPIRTASARALTDCQLLRIEKSVMMTALAQEGALLRAFIAHVVTRIVRCQRDLVDQRTQPAEKRLARILLQLARFEGQSSPEAVAPKVSHEFLSEMVGTTRSRITFFLNRFRDAGFITYEIGDPELRVRQSLSDFCAIGVSASLLLKPGAPTR